MTQTPSQPTLSYLAAALFFLAGMIQIVSGFLGHRVHPISISIGAMFLAVGALWLVIAAKSKKNSGR